MTRGDSAPTDDGGTATGATAADDAGAAADTAPLRVSPGDRSVRVPRAGDESARQRGGLPASNWLPTRLSTLLVAVATALGTLLFANAAGLTAVAAVGAASALALAGALRLATAERWRVPATLGATVLLVPVGVGLAGSQLAGFLVMQDRLFPVATAVQYVGAMLRALGALAVVAGASLAWFGAATATRDAVERDALRRTLGVSFRTAVPPFVVALLGGTIRLAESPTHPPYVGTEGVVGGLVGVAASLTVSPPTLQAHPTTLCLLAVAALWVVGKLVDTLPVAEVLGERSPAVRAARRLRTVAIYGLLVVLLAAIVEFLVPTPAMQGLLGFDGYRLLVRLTTTPLLRLPLTAVAAVGGAVVLAVGLFRRLARVPAAETLGWLLPYATGGALVLAAGSVARPLVEGLLDAVAAVLISPFDETFARLAGSVVRFYGPELVLTALLAGVLVLTAGVVLSLYLAERLGYVRDRANGASLAATGLFLAAAFAVPVGASAPLAFAGLVASVLAWDAGLYGATLGREVGRRAPTARVELTHATGTVAVGALGVALAVGLVRTLESDRLAAPAGVPVTASVVLALAGTFLLIVVLRATE